MKVKLKAQSLLINLRRRGMSRAGMRVRSKWRVRKDDGREFSGHPVAHDGALSSRSLT